MRQQRSQQRQLLSVDLAPAQHSAVHTAPCPDLPCVAATSPLLAAGMSARMLIEANLTQVGSDFPVPQVNESELASTTIWFCSAERGCADCAGQQSSSAADGSSNAKAVQAACSSRQLGLFRRPLLNPACLASLPPRVGSRPAAPHRCDGAGAEPAGGGCVHQVRFLFPIFSSGEELQCNSRVCLHTGGSGCGL